MKISNASLRFALGRHIPGFQLKATFNLKNKRKENAL